MTTEHRYTVNFICDGKVVDQLLVCSDEAFDADRALARHRHWNPRWPETHRPDAAVLSKVEVA